MFIVTSAFAISGYENKGQTDKAKRYKTKILICKLNGLWYILFRILDRIYGKDLHLLKYNEDCMHSNYVDGHF